MKTILAALALGAAASLIGCNDATPLEMESIDSVDSALLACNTNAGLYPLKAALAVSMAREMKRIHATRDLMIHPTTGLVAVSAYGYNRCASAGFTGCPNTNAILDLQKPIVNNYIAQEVLNTITIREDLRASFQRQTDHENNLLWNSPSLAPKEHTLTQIGTFTKDGACGVHFEFFAEGSSIDNIKERLVFFGGAQNDFLDFLASTDTISIDPTATMNGDTSTSTLSCTASCTSTTLGLKGSCCACNGKNGTFQPAPWNTRTLYCAY